MPLGDVNAEQKENKDLRRFARRRLMPKTPPYTRTSHPAPMLGAFHAVMEAFVATGEKRYFAVLLQLCFGHRMPSLSKDRAASYFPVAGGAAGNETDPLANLGGRSIAVYTLTTRAAEQFRRVVEARAPGAAVTLLHDLDASKRLEQHARQAALFVLVTASAKHAATDCTMSNLAQQLGHSLVFPVDCKYCGAPVYLFASPDGGSPTPRSEAVSRGVPTGRR
jgi:hypothetical protein